MPDEQTMLLHVADAAKTLALSKSKTYQLVHSSTTAALHGIGG